MTIRIGSLCSGYGGLDLAVEALFPDAKLAWYAQYEPPGKNGRPDRQSAAQIMAHHWPSVPNLGDITTVDYGGVQRVDVLTAGFPCTDISLAGKRAGLRAGTRSGIWSHVARAIGELRPALVLIENVRSLTSAWADSDLEFDPRCMGAAGDDGASVQGLRALGCVLGDLADLGFDAEWVVVPASAVGAPHKRERVFVLAWPAADTSDLGHQRGRGTRGRRRRPAHSGLATSDAQGVGRAEGRSEPARLIGRLDAAERGGAPSADPAGPGREGPRPESARRGPEPGGQSAADTHVLGDLDGELPPGRNTLRRGLRADAAGRGAPAADPDGGRRGPDEPDDAAREPDAGRRDPFPWDATEYGPAIARWEEVLDRPAPWPTDHRRRLAPTFSEFMMGLPAGWVTDVPGLSRSAQLKALGNGVVPQQAALALRLLLPAYWAAVQPADGFDLIRNGTHQQATTGSACGDAERAA